MEWVLGMKQNVQKNAFDEGSYTHSLCLEPDKIKAEYAIYEGLRKSGERYEQFKAENSGKIILSAAQKLRGDKYFEVYSGRPEAVSLLSYGHPEHTMFGKLQGIPVKVRADYINLNNNYLVDIKTTAYPSDLECFKETIKEYKYDLSASLYLDIAEQTYNRLFDFYFIVISKCDLVCDVYKLSADTRSAGASLVTHAISKYKKCKESGIWLDNAPKVSYSSDTYEVREV